MKSRLQSSFELLMTLAFGLAILTPLVLVAFLQLSNATLSLTSIESQQAANKLASIATLVGSQGPPAKQLVQIQVPSGVQYIYIGSYSNNIGHEVIFVVRSPTGQSYITSYTPANISGNLGGLVTQGTYLINVSSVSNCPTNAYLGCVFMSPAI